MNSPGVTSRSTSRNATCARLVPSAHTLPTLRQTTASLEENGLNGLEATQHPRGLRHPIEDLSLQQPHQPIRAEAEQTDQRDGEEYQRGIERIARQHDDLPET